MKAAGLGFRAGATVDSIRNAFEAAGGRADALAVPADKANADCLVAFAKDVGLDVIAVTTADMAAVSTLTHSPKVQAKRGTGSVAEACALVAAGADARLLGARVVSGDRMATCAMAERD